MELVGVRDERIVFATWHLDVLRCPRRGFWRLRAGTAEEARAEAARLACAGAVAELAQAGWPDDWFDRLPTLVARSLIGRWRFGAYDAGQYHREVGRLSDLLRRFLRGWRPPPGAAWQAEPNVRWDDRAGGVAVLGRLDCSSPARPARRAPASCWIGGSTTNAWATRSRPPEWWRWRRWRMPASACSARWKSDAST